MKPSILAALALALGLTACSTELADGTSDDYVPENPEAVDAGGAPGADFKNSDVSDEFAEAIEATQLAIRFEDSSTYSLRMTDAVNALEDRLEELVEESPDGVEASTKALADMEAELNELREEIEALRTRSAANWSDRATALRDEVEAFGARVDKLATDLGVD